MPYGGVSALIKSIAVKTLILLEFKHTIPFQAKKIS